MTFYEFKKQALKEYYPALFLENLWPQGRGKLLVQGLRGTAALLLVIGILVDGLSRTSPTLYFYVPKVFGACLLATALWLGAAAIRTFYNYYYFKNQPEKPNDNDTMSFELARILYLSSAQDILAGFLHSQEGNEILLRSGITSDAIKAFIAGRTQPIDINTLMIKKNQYNTLTDYAALLYDADKEFSDFLFAHRIQKKDFLAIVDWVIERHQARRAQLRWWSRENLGRIQGIGKNWSYGQINTLQKYAEEIPDIEGEEYETHDVYGTRELKLLEAVMAKQKGANALLVGNDKAGVLHILARLNRAILTGTIMPQLEHKRLIMISSEVFSASVKNKAAFESELLSLLREAHNAGNIILVLEDFPALLLSAETYGVDLTALLDPYLTARHLHIIAHSDTAHFHAKIERDLMLIQRFERILIEDIGDENTIKVLQNEIITVEAQTGLFFSYPALVAIADSAERYFPDTAMPQQAINLLSEIASKLSLGHKGLVEKEDVLDIVTVKTGIPVGDMKDEERDKLLQLETILHQRIIGQDEAVTAISHAVRRARSGINNPNRPLGSFLFLGPTGVGKTETTKALGDIFFGKDLQIQRLDMSEYSTPDALSKLIGSFASGKFGVLASVVREHPYGVLLLDEFEKTTPEVMNLFLQILDEGFFSDMEGKKINARNLLIIATSNAGSDLIWESLRRGDDQTHAKELLIDSMVQNHIFKAELLNRFDGIIAFHPLGTEHLLKIAELQLQKLKKRLAERGINLAITSELIEFLVKIGTDPKFGARPMNRAIQDKVEQVIAEKMLRREIKPGAEIRLTRADLE